LQHEVSVQKIALSSLQNEHDKLLSAFSRAQTRINALERKHDVSDTEIITLTEEKLRLQAQVTELERDIEELARSRDEFRQAAVQEGSQYVEIVKKASLLEAIAGEERKVWKRTLSQYVGTDVDSDDFQHEHIDQDEADSSGRRQRRKTSGESTIAAQDLSTAVASTPKKDQLAG
jgi:chromosome segregation ATPase